MKSKLFVVLSCIILFALVLSFFSFPTNYSPSKDQIIANQVRDNAARKIEAEKDKSKEQASSDEMKLSQALRIESLLPIKDRMYSLAIDPAIPKHFIALSPSKEPTSGLTGELSSDAFYWGPKETLLSYFKDPLSLSEPIFGFKLTSDITQPRFGVLDERFFREQFSELNQSGEGELSLDFGYWGYYPYCIIGGIFRNFKINMAYVGLNHESGAILRIDLVPFHNASPEMEQEAVTLWRNFFDNTTELSEPFFYKALGQELQTGFTFVKILDRTVKVIAERRKSDKVVRFAVIPQNSDVEFKFESAEITHKGKYWRFGDPILKLKCAYIVNKGWLHLSTTTSIFIKEVDEFTPVNILKPHAFLGEVKYDPKFSLSML